MSIAPITVPSRTIGRVSGSGAEKVPASGQAPTTSEASSSPARTTARGADSASASARARSAGRPTEPVRDSQLSAE